MGGVRPSRGALIVGAGPTGLTLAHELLRLGVPARLIDKERVPSPNARALGIWTRTLELFARAGTGVADEMVERGVRTPTFHVWSSGRRLVRLDFAHGIDGPYPFVLMLPQPETEAILAERVNELGGSVDRGTELLDLTRRDDGVEVVLRRADGREERTTTAWLIGCDGARSTVRNMLGVPFMGKTFEQSFLTGNVTVEWDLPPDEAHAFLDRGNFVAFFPMPDAGRYRIVIAYQRGQAPAGDPTLAEVQQGISVYGPAGARASEPVGLTRFLVNQRKVETYVSGRVALAGDAAHIHTFIGAQGMNTGIQDAFNLGWKLALVIKGHATAGLLDSYQRERENVSKGLLIATERATRFALMRNPVLTGVRDVLAPWVTARPLPQQLIVNGLAELRISYRSSPIVRQVRGEPAASRSRLRAGDRAPDGVVLDVDDAPRRLFDLLSAARHTLLVFSPRDEAALPHVGGTYPPEFIDGYRIVRARVGSPRGEGALPTLVDPDGSLARRYGLTRGGLVLIRPDGYLGLHSELIAAEPIRDYLTGLGSAQSGPKQ